MSLSDFYLNSDFRIKILNAIKNDAIEFVSFDIFDTLVRRNCNKPSDIFTRIAEKAILEGILINCDSDSFRNSRIYFEKKARLNSTNQDVTLHEIYANSPYPKKTQQALIEIEKRAELESLSLDPIAYRLVAEVSKSKKIIAISDMYLDSSFISGLLSKLLPKIHFSQIFISSETKLTKASGDMYSHVLNELKINAKNLIHIGDNVKSDFNNAIEMGIKAFHYNSPSWLERAFKRENIFQNKYSTFIQKARVTASLLSPNNYSHEETMAFLNGCAIHAPTIVGFVKWIRKESELRGIEKHLFLMREGEIYKRIFDYFFEKSNSEILYASRKATYLPSISTEELNKEISEVLSRKNYTVKNLAQDLYLPTQMIETLESIAGEEIQFITSDIQKAKKLREALEQSEIQILEKIQDKKAIFKAYTKEHLNGQLPALIDFGAGATINYQITKALEEPAIHHFLFYATDRAYSRTHKLSLSSFLPLNDDTRKNINYLYRSPEIFEFFLVGKNTTTLDYEKVNDTIKPILCTNKTSPYNKKLIDAFNHGVDCYIAATNAFDHDEGSVEARLAAISVLTRQVTFPTLEEVQFLGDLGHNDNFGADSQYKIIEEEEINQVSKLGIHEFWKEHKTYKGTLSHRITWPHGLITKLEHDYLAKNVFLLEENEHKHAESLLKIAAQLPPLRNKTAIVYGAGEFFDELEILLDSENIKIEFLIDKKATLGSFTKRNYKVISPENAKKMNKNNIIVASEAFLDEIKQNINSLNICNGVIITC